MSDSGAGAPTTDEHWAADQVVRQHEIGRCKQCTDTTCPMLVWAHSVLADGMVPYPRVAPVQPLLTG
jgi:hypothetical protein